MLAGSAKTTDDQSSFIHFRETTDSRLTHLVTCNKRFFLSLIYVHNVVMHPSTHAMSARACSRCDVCGTNDATSAEPNCAITLSSTSV